MTETEWLEDTDPQEMLDFLRPELTERKAGLLAASWCRCIWQLLGDTRCQQVIEIAERFADGLASVSEMRFASENASDAYLGGDFPLPYGLVEEVTLFFKATSIARQSTCFLVRESDSFLVDCFLCVDKALMRWEMLRAAPDQKLNDYWTRVRVLQDLMYEVIGNPLRPVALVPAWLTWNDGTIPRIAQAIYDDRLMPSGAMDTGGFAVLADALEEAGCTNADILAHCQKPGRHVRGCWVVDLVLGKC